MKRLPVIVIVLAIAGQMAFAQLWAVYQAWDETPVHRGIIAGTEEPPFRYRVLVPLAAEALRPLFPVGEVESVIIAHDALSAVFIVGFVFTLYRFLRRFYAPALALCGLALVSSAAQLMAVRPHMIGYSWLEAWLFTAALDWLWVNVWGADGRQDGAKMEVIERITS